MESIRKNSAMVLLLLIFMVIVGCTEKTSKVGIEGEYLVNNKKESKDKDSEGVLKIVNIEENKYSFKVWYGDKLKYDYVFVVRGNIVYDLSETVKVGEFNDDFQRFINGRMIYDRIN